MAYTTFTIPQRSIYSNGKKVSPESERYRKFPFGYSRIVHRDIHVCTFILMFSHGNKSRAGQGAP